MQSGSTYLEFGSRRRRRNATYAVVPGHCLQFLHWGILGTTHCHSRENPPTTAICGAHRIWSLALCASCGAGAIARCYNQASPALDTRIPVGHPFHCHPSSCAIAVHVVRVEAGAAPCSHKCQPPDFRAGPQHVLHCHTNMFTPGLDSRLCGLAATVFMPAHNALCKVVGHGAFVARRGVGC